MLAECEQKGGNALGWAVWLTQSVGRSVSGCTEQSVSEGWGKRAGQRPKHGCMAMQSRRHRTRAARTATSAGGAGCMAASMPRWYSATCRRGKRDRDTKPGVLGECPARDVGCVPACLPATCDSPPMQLPAGLLSQGASGSRTQQGLQHSTPPDRTCCSSASYCAITASICALCAACTSAIFSCSLRICGWAGRHVGGQTGVQMGQGLGMARLFTQGARGGMGKE